MNDQKNSLVDKIKEMYAKYIPIITLLKQKQIPENYPNDEDEKVFSHSLGSSSLYARDEIVQNSCFCLLAYDWIRPLAKWIGKRKCLEIMCGSGALSKGLQDCGIDIQATDDFSWPHFKEPWTNIEKLSAVDAIKKYGRERDIVICSWPPMDSAAHDALLTMRQVNPSALMIYIGESNEGCTADDNFFATIRYVEDEFFYKAIENYKSIWGIHDYPYLIK